MADKKKSLVPAFLRSDGPNHPILWTLFGAAATLLLGFAWAGWWLDSSVMKATTQAKIEGRVEALAPECARMMLKIPEGMAELDKASEYSYAGIVQKRVPEVIGLKVDDETGKRCGIAAKELAKKKS